jgi:hypothetical protein
MHYLAGDKVCIALRLWSIHRDDLVVKPGEAGLPLADDLRLEAAVPVAWRLQFDLAEVAFKVFFALPFREFPLLYPAGSCLAKPRCWLSSAFIARSSNAFVICFSKPSSPMMSSGVL